MLERRVSGRAVPGAVDWPSHPVLGARGRYVALWAAHCALLLDVGDLSALPRQPRLPFCVPARGSPGNGAFRRASPLPPTRTSRRYKVNDSLWWTEVSRALTFFVFWRKSTPDLSACLWLAILRRGMRQSVTRGDSNTVRTPLKSRISVRMAHLLYNPAIPARHRRRCRLPPGISAATVRQVFGS